MRGKQADGARADVTHRIIPAHAGQTRTRRARRTVRADHPRACGANLAYEVIELHNAGSSPRMRGKPSQP